MAFIDKLREAERQANARPRDPWEDRLKRALDGVQAMSTVALLDLIGARSTTGNARRLATIMRALHFIPIKNRRLEPGGHRDTVARGWARPIRGTSPLQMQDRSRPVSTYEGRKP
jgi:hypothetical protein